MRRKIALLLAFAMVISILPMNVFAFFPAAVTGGGTRTGMIAEPAGPARNVRHWGDGVAVGRQWVVTPIVNNSNLAAAPQGNLRHILADAAYFAGRTDNATSASMVMNILRVDRWLGWGNPTGFSPAISTWRTLPGNVSGGVVQSSTNDATTPPAAEPDAPTAPPPNWNAGGTADAVRGNIRQYVLQGAEGVAADNFVNFVYDMIPATGAVPPALQQLVDGVFVMGTVPLPGDAPGAAVARRNEFLRLFFQQGWNSPSLTALSMRIAGLDSGLPPGTVTFVAGIVTRSERSANLIVWRPSADASIPFLTSVDNWVQLPIEYVTAGYVNDHPVHLEFFEDSGWPQAGQVRPGGGVPGRTELTATTDARFSFGTEGDVRTFHRYQRGVLPAIRIAEGAQGAFDNQYWWIELTIQQNGFFFTEASMEDVRFTTRWGQVPPTAASGSPMLGNNMASGTLRNTPRIPDSRIQAIVPTTEVVRTPNPAPGSLGWWDGWRPSGSGNGAPSDEASQLGMLRIEDGPVRREPETGPNRYRTLVFGVHLPGAGGELIQPERIVNDWIDIHGLTIIADDRAREGDVEILVELFRAPYIVAETTQNFTGTITPNNPGFMQGLTGWNWVAPISNDLPTSHFPDAADTVSITTVTAPDGTVTETRTVTAGTGWRGLHPGLPGGNVIVPVRVPQAQARGESVFLYQRTPQMFERFDPNDDDHVDAASQFNLLPRDPSVVIDGVADGGFIATGIPVASSVFAQVPSQAHFEAIFGAGVTEITNANRQFFWREITATEGVPRFRAFAATGNIHPTLSPAQIGLFDNDLASAGAPGDALSPQTTGAGGIWEVWRSAATDPWTPYGALRWEVRNDLQINLPTQNITLQPAGTRPYHERGDRVDYGTVTVARFGTLGLVLELHPEDSADDHWLLSGVRDWQFSREVTNDGRRPIGAVTEIIDDTNHLTARARLRELSPGAMAATGGNPVTFSFDEGIQILGARIWANDANFARFNDSDQRIFFGDRFNVADSFLGAAIERNTLTLRPEVGSSLPSDQNRWRLAQITVEFYLSVMPGFEREFGDEIWLHVLTSDASTAGGEFSDSVVVAHAEDPIEVDTTVTTVGSIDPAEFGSLHTISINDITITEVLARNLEAGSRLWVGVEGGLSRGFGAADHISLTAGSVEVVGGGTLDVGPLRSDTHGAYVEILRPSNVDGAQIIFRDVLISGRVFADTEYNIIVAGNAVAANWEEFLWLDGDMPTGIARGGIHGFFHEEPYPTPGFVFAGEDVGITELPAPAPAPEPPAPPAPTAQPRIVNQGAPFVTGRGETIFPSFEMRPNPTNPQNATAFLAGAIVRDILGWEDSWDPVARTGTFTKPNGDVLVFTEGQSTATLNGQSFQMVDTEGAPVAASISTLNDRFMVPIRFFNDIGIRVTWMGGSPGNFSLMVSP